MSVGSIKKLLVLINVVAVLAIGGTAYGFWSHNKYMGESHDWPKFKSNPKVISEDIGRTGNTTMALGRFPKKVEQNTGPKPEEKKEKIEEFLDRLGTITSAIVLYPTKVDSETGMLVYDPSAETQPAITFKLKTGGGTLTLSLNEAIENRPHPEYGKNFPIPYAYKFIGCEPVEGDPTAVYFKFDMKADGTDIQKKLWKGDEKANPLETAKGPLSSDGALNVKTKHGLFIDESEIARSKAAAEAKKKAAAAKKKDPITEPVKVEPDQVLPTVKDGIPSELFEEDSGTLGATREGAEYLEKNWKKVIEEAKTTTYRNPDTGKAEGVLIRSIRSGSVAGKFGIYQDDVITHINGRSVTSRADAIKVVRNEIEQRKRKIIEVKLLRNGKPLAKRYDVRDPETRRAARALR